MTLAHRGTPTPKAAAWLPLPFVIATSLLAIAWLLAVPIANYFNLKQSKEALSLKAPLSALNPMHLVPYQVVERTVLDPTMQEALGTKDYIQWILEDTRVPQSDPLRFANLFVTYYSGGSNLVPHVPDVCYLGAGYQPTRPHDSVDLDVPGAVGRVHVQLQRTVREHPDGGARAD